MPRFPGFIGPSYTFQSINFDCQRCINMYPELNELGTGKDKEVAALVSTPGLTRRVTLPTYPVRGIWTASNGEVYAVGGNKLYQLYSSWVATELGSLNTSTGRVSMADNGIQVIIVDGTDGYYYNMSTDTFAKITDPDFKPADLVTFMDGYFLLNESGTKNFFWSGLYDVTFDALDSAAVEGKPDNLLGLVAMNQSIYLFGSQSTEVFYNSGEADQPFQRNQGAVNDIGCAAVHTIQQMGTSLFWVGGDPSGSGIVYQMIGFQPKRISTYAIEQIIREIGVTNLASAKAWCYQQGGHQFYCLNLPTHNATFVYDASTGLWHERAYLNTLALERSRADCHAEGFGYSIVGDYDNGKIYTQDLGVYTEDGVALVRERTAPHLSSEDVFIRHSSFQLDMEVGVGLSGTGQGTDPLAILTFSNDGGHSWSNEKFRSIGKAGEYRTRVIWNRLGVARDRVYRIRITDPVKVVMIGADLNIERGVA